TSASFAPTFDVAVAGVTVTDPTAGAVVVAAATFDHPPNTAFTLSVPRNATSSKLYAVPGVRPRTVHVIVLPMVVPTRGDLQVPRATLVADPHWIGAGANRISTAAVPPAPSGT